MSETARRHQGLIAMAVSSITGQDMRFVTLCNRMSIGEYPSDIKFFVQAMRRTLNGREHRMKQLVNLISGKTGLSR